MFSCNRRKLSYVTTAPVSIVSVFATVVPPVIAAFSTGPLNGRTYLIDVTYIAQVFSPLFGDDVGSSVETPSCFRSRIQPTMSKLSNAPQLMFFREHQLQAIRWPRHSHQRPRTSRFRCSPPLPPSRRLASSSSAGMRAAAPSGSTTITRLRRSFRRWG